MLAANVDPISCQGTEEVWEAVFAVTPSFSGGDIVINGEHTDTAIGEIASNYG